MGLSVFTVEQRAKEIGVRKVLGAKVRDILILLSRDFVKRVVLALLIAVPLARYIMVEWLQDFEYKVDIGIGTYMVAGLIALVLVLAAIGWQSVRVATGNPVNSLRSE